MISNEQEAWSILQTNFFEVGGQIYRKSLDEPISDREYEAIRYLFEEYDYSFYDGEV